MIKYLRSWYAVGVFISVLSLGVVQGSAPACAGISVFPVHLTVHAPDTRTELTLKVSGGGPVNLQVRVMRWHKGTDPGQMEPTRDVVASPPFATLRTGEELTARIVRIAKRPVQREECYRVLVDQLPQQTGAGGSVGLLIRQSLPLCFEP